MEVFCTFPVEEILPIIGNKNSNGLHGENEFAILLNFKVRVNSLRLQCFKRNQSCVSCNIKGTIFRLERHSSQIKNNQAPHLNMYAFDEVKNKYILMTKDHILSKARGGQCIPSNLQTMCHICNEEKGAT